MSTDLRTARDEHLCTMVAGSRSEEACAELFRRYRKRIYLWCHGYTHDVEEAVDCTQEIFVKAFANLAGFGGRARFSTWLYSIARNHCLGLLAQRGERWRRRLVPIDGVEVEDPECVEAFRQAELTQVLERILAAAGDRMADDELEAFVLHYREGLSVKEITQVLGCQNQTGARSLIQNARRKFQRLVRRKEYPGD